MSRLYLSNPCAFLSILAHGAAGAVSARLSLRPLSERGTMRLQNSDRKHVARLPTAVIASEGGRSSIPEAAVLESKGRGVLDHPLSRVMTSGVCLASERRRLHLP